MNEYVILFLLVVINFCSGMFFGYNMSMFIKNNKTKSDEKTVYCHGFEDGVYHTLGEYNPDYFRVEIAENCYKEYKAIKNGPENH